MLKPTLGNSDGVVNGCCTSKEAWAWVADMAEGALNGDDDYRGNLLAAIEHALGARSECSVIPDELVPAAIAWAVHGLHAPDIAHWCPFCREGALT